MVGWWWWWRRRRRRRRIGWVDHKNVERLRSVRLLSVTARVLLDKHLSTTVAERRELTQVSRVATVVCCDASEDGRTVEFLREVDVVRLVSHRRRCGDGLIPESADGAHSSRHCHPAEHLLVVSRVRAVFLQLDLEPIVGHSLLAGLRPVAARVCLHLGDDDRALNRRVERRLHPF